MKHALARVCGYIGLYIYIVDVSGGTIYAACAARAKCICIEIDPEGSDSGIFLSGGGGGRGALPPLNFNNPKRSKIWYVACGTIIRRVVAAAKCKSSVIDLLIFLNVFWMFCEMSGPLSHAVYRQVHNCGPFNLLYTWTSEPCSILKGPQFCQKVQNLSKRSKISNVPPWKYDKNIPVIYVGGIFLGRMVNI